MTSAGHLPPVLRHPGGTTELIDLPPGLLLGAGTGPYPTVDRQLAPGSVLALYTDGLIEEPGQDIGIGMSRLARALAEGPARSPTAHAPQDFRGQGSSLARPAILACRPERQTRSRPIHAERAIAGRTSAICRATMMRLCADQVGRQLRTCRDHG